MLDKLQRFREPVAWALLGTTALQVLLTIIAFGVAAAGVGGLAAAGYAAGYPLAGGLVIAGAVVVGSCVYWGQRTPNARLLTLIAAALYAAAVLVDVVVAVIGMVGGSGIPSMLSEILQATLPAVVAVVLFGIWDSLPAPARQRALPGPPPDWGPPPQHQQQQWQPGPWQPQEHSQPHGQPPWRPPHPSDSRPDRAPRPYPQTGPSSRPHSNQQQPYDEPTIGIGQSLGAPSRNDQFGRPPANWGINSVGYSDPGQTSPGSVEPGAPGQGTDQLAWRPAPQAPPQRLQPQPGGSPVGPHNAAPTSAPQPQQVADATSASRFQASPAPGDDLSHDPDQDRLPPPSSGPAAVEVDHDPGTPGAPGR